MELDVCVGSANRQGSAAEGLGRGGGVRPEAAVRAKPSMLPHQPRESLGTEFVSAACLHGQEGGRARGPSSQNAGKKIISKKQQVYKNIK